MKPTHGALAAYVLHRWDWSETSLIVELLTRERGRLVVAAKGAKRPTSQLRPVLLPFQRIAVTLARAGAETEVHTLRGAEWAPASGGVPLLAGGAIYAGFYAHELLMKLSAREDPHPALFDAYEATLPALAGDDETAAAALRAFELVLLRETGVLPALDAVTLTAEPLADAARYALHAEAGVVATGAEPALAAPTLRALEAALVRRDLAALREACRSGAPALRARLREVLDHHLGGAALRTRRVLQEVQRLAEAPRR